MKRYKVTDKTGAFLEYIAPSPLDWQRLGLGKHERWVPATEPHDPADVLEQESRVSQPEQPAVIDENGVEISPAIPAVMAVWVKLKAEYTVEETDITQQVEQERINREAQEYLDLTDWLIIRELDAGVPCPEEVKKARAEARARIVR